MPFKSHIKKFIKKTTGLTIYKILPFGLDPYNDIKYQIKHLNLNLFFDVGANIGQTALHIREYFPNSKILCFEPINATFNALKSNVSKLDIECYQIAFGSSDGEIEISLNNETPDMNSLLNIENNRVLNKQKIKIQTITGFCKSHSIQFIDYLKIDTEGYDLEVLKGSEEMLLRNDIYFIEIETGINPDNKFHVSFIDIKAFLEKMDYRVYGIYEQIHEWKIKKPILRRVNALFISERIYNKSF